MKKTMKRVSLFFMAAIILTALPLAGGKAEAARKVTLSSSSMTIPVGSMEKGDCWSISETKAGSAAKLTVKKGIRNAKYVFTSSNTSIVKIAKSGGYLTGVKAGRATITCKQTLRGKTTVIGKCKVTVKDAVLTGNTSHIISLGKTEIVREPAEAEEFAVTYRNPDARYEFLPDKLGLSIEEQVIEDTGIYWDTDYDGDTIRKLIVTAERADNYNITVWEIYKNRRREVGTIKITVMAPAVVEKLTEFPVNSRKEIQLVNYPAQDKTYYYKVEWGGDNISVAADIGEQGKAVITAENTGTARIRVYDNSGIVLGFVDVTVISIPLRSIEDMPDKASTYVGDFDFTIPFFLNPMDTTDKVQVISSDPGVLSVMELFSEEGQEWIYIPLTPGTTTITVFAGGITKYCQVTVYGSAS